MNNQDKLRGKYESMKFASLRPEYEESRKKLYTLDFEANEYVDQFPAFIGHLTLSRYLVLYEAYKLALGVAGHIAEIGMYLGTVSLYFAKLSQLFEPNSLTLVHGFDWFKGAKVTEEEKYVRDGEFQADYDLVRKLIEFQNLEGIVHAHDLDLTKDLDGFFEENSHLQFKLIFIDCGIHEVLTESIKHFWPRLTPGGIMVFDHFSHEFAPGEIRAIHDLLPDEKFKTFPFGWMPTAYVRKGD